MILLLVGSALSTATQLRIAPLPFGPGETLIAAGLAISVLRASWFHSSEIVGKPGDFLIYWLVGFALLALGALGGSLIGSQPGAAAAYDAAAYLFAALFCIALEPVVAGRPREALLGLVVAMSLVVVTTVLVATLAGRLPFVDPWYALIRLRGLSENPNQLALLCVAYPFLCWQLLADNVVSSRRWTWFVSAAGVVIGVMTLSDALLVSWGAAMAIVGSILVVRQLRRLQSPHVALFLIAAVLGAGTAIVGSGVAGKIGPRLYDQILAGYEEGAQGSVRLDLWRHAAEAVWQTGTLGAGPGAHSGLTGPFESFEAHNVYLDWMAASGVAGLVLLGSLLAIILVRCIRSRSLFLVGALIGLMVFGVFHHVLRQPVFWSCLIVISCYARAMAKHESRFVVVGNRLRTHGGSLPSVTPAR